MNRLTDRGLGLALALAPMIVGCSPAKPPQVSPSAAVSHGSMAGMSMGDTSTVGMSTQGMSTAGMSIPVTIPKGVLYTEADVRFMQGMIAHHGQAIYMSAMAAGHRANPRVLKLATKIAQSQIAEIRLMQNWLRSNGQIAPDSASWRGMQMPGMLTAAQLEQLNAAQGAAFDQQFLTLMIQHHNGALEMVADLLAAPLAAQDVDVSVFANDVQVVQSAEIATMEQMLANL